jgi:hypothetical protein
MMYQDTVQVQGSEFILIRSAAASVAIRDQLYTYSYNKSER